MSLKFSYKNGLNITSIETQLILAVAGLIHAKVQPDWFMHAFINVRQMGTEEQEDETNKHSFETMLCISHLSKAVVPLY